MRAVCEAAQIQHRLPDGRREAREESAIADLDRGAPRAAVEPPFISDDAGAADGEARARARRDAGRTADDVGPFGNARAVIEALRRRPARERIGAQRIVLRRRVHEAGRAGLVRAVGAAEEAAGVIWPDHWVRNLIEQIVKELDLCGDAVARRVRIGTAEHVRHVAHDVKAGVGAISDARVCTVAGDEEIDRRADDVLRHRLALEKKIGVQVRHRVVFENRPRPRLAVDDVIEVEAKISHDHNRGAVALIAGAERV